MIDGTVIQKVGWYDLLDDFSLDLVSEILSRDFLRMLGRDYDGVDAKRYSGTAVFLVLDCDLSLRVWSEPRELTTTTSSGHCSIQLVRKHDGQRHVLLSLIGSVTKHNPLITSAVIFKRTMIQTLSNIRGLLLNCNEDVAGFVVKTFGRVVISDMLDSVADDFLVVNLSLSGDFTENHDHASLRGSLTSNLRRRILS